MANFTTVAKQSSATLKLLQQRRDFIKAIGNPAGGVITAPTSPPVKDPDDDGIEPLEIARVKPGDLITADFINDLIDVVVAVDTRLQRIEDLLARLIDRETKKTQPQQPLQPAEGKP